MRSPWRKADKGGACAAGSTRGSQKVNTMEEPVEDEGVPSVGRDGGIARRRCARCQEVAVRERSVDFVAADAGTSTEMVDHTHKASIASFGQHVEGSTMLPRPLPVAYRRFIGEAAGLSLDTDVIDPPMVAKDFISL